MTIEDYELELQNASAALNNMSPEDFDSTEFVPIGVAMQMIKELTEKLSHSITWGVLDFESRAAELCDCEEDDNSWEKVYDKSKFKEALELMIHHHDCNNGISWGDVDFYLEEYCKK